MKTLLFAVLTVGLLTGQGIAGQSKRESVQGVWQAVEVTITGPGARTIAIPEARDLESIDRAMPGQDAVLSTFGPRSPKKDDVQEVLMRNLIAAMTKHGITRLVNLSVWGSGGAAVPPVNPIARYFVFPVVLRYILADKRRGEACLFDSALMYVNVCPGRLTNAAARGGVRASIDGKGLKQYMHREDLAAFMVGQLIEDTWVRQCVAIGY